MSAGRAMRHESCRGAAAHSRHDADAIHHRPATPAAVSGLRLAEGAPHRVRAAHGGGVRGGRAWRVRAGRVRHRSRVTDYECRDCGAPLRGWHPTMTDAVRAAVYGHLVGDAIGVPYEFTDADPRRVVELRGYGTHYQPPGTWSDDGSLMLALLDSLVERRLRPRRPGPSCPRVGRCKGLHPGRRRRLRHRWRDLGGAEPAARGRASRGCRRHW